MYRPNWYQLGFILVAIMSTACGSSKRNIDDGNKAQNSRNTPEPGTPVVVDGTTINYFNECNFFQNQDQDLVGRLQTFVYPDSTSYEWQWIRVKLDQVPSEVVNGNTAYIQFFRWSADAPGQTFVNNSPTSIYVLYKDKFTYLNSQPIDTLSKNTIENIIEASKGLNLSTPLTLQNFFANVTLVLADVDLIYDAIMINTYDSSSGSSAQSTTNALIPAFASDPNLYAKTHPAVELQRIHPSYSLRTNSSYNEYGYKQLSEQYCFFK